MISNILCAQALAWTNPTSSPKQNTLTKSSPDITKDLVIRPTSFISSMTASGPDQLLLLLSMTG